jgi:translation initiation factor 1
MGLFDGTPWEHDVVCERCGRPENDCVCPASEEAADSFMPADQQRVCIAVEKRKKGKRVTTVNGLLGPNAQRRELLARLKTACGSGGTEKNGVIEIQGSHQQRITELLSELGYRL